MSGILHMPQGGAQVSMISQIPETIIEGRDITLQEMLDTLATYTYVIKTDNSYNLVSNIWNNDTPDWGKNPSSGNGDQVIINYDKHNGLNFQPQMRDTDQQYMFPVKAMLINRTINLASNRVIGFCKMSEASWTSTDVTIYFIPYDSNKTTQDYVTMLLDKMNGASNGVYTMTFVHNGVSPQNDIEALMVGELTSAGKYLCAISTSSSQDNACPSIYNLVFRTY